MLCVSFLSCATTGAKESAISEEADLTTERTSNTENKRKEEKLRFDDWKYRGFGSELPVWIEAAVDSNIKVLKKLIPELANVGNVIVVVGRGENQDQAEQMAKELAEMNRAENPNLSFYDSFWVREAYTNKLKEKPYASVHILYEE